ncbi:hypothetical protein FIBSPDRAFT_723235 [Athelia psychrophila]|uniref:Mitochondrial import inner membrane translocase subunit n=1 Tax=Athelia psychrophila TaxID=1759441 RepID=A0A166V4P5_9AGAM|nr:hypothetical protein FIBSPDRAFT_723235 [Fibularhizoctonia sp. CBS 109695]
MDKFDDATQKELQTFLEQEQAHSRVQTAVHKLTGICWDKCITGTPSTSFGRGEAACMANCVERFLDTSLFMVRKVAEQRQAQQ